MNTTHVKLMTWTLSGLLGVGLSLTVGSFLAKKAEIEKSVDPKFMKSTLDNVPEPVVKVDDMLSIEEVYASLTTPDWTGKAAPPPPKPTGPAPIVPQRDVPVADLVVVLLIKEDTTDPAGSNCVLTYTAKAKVPPLPSGNTAVVKFIGDRLDGDHGHVRIAGITEEAVEFAFDKEGREPEFLEPKEFPQTTLIARANQSSTSSQVAQPALIPKVQNRSKITKTVRVAPNVYRMGTEDAAYLDQHYDDILAQVRSRRWRDPVTGKYAGIQIMEVPAGSFAAQHGAMEGDIIKSINGYPVTSAQEAITFAKNNANQYTKWEIEVENKGRTRFVTYIPPK